MSKKEMIKKELIKEPYTPSERISRIDKLFHQINSMIRNSEEGKFISEGEEILSKDANAVNAIADLFDQMYGTGTCVTGYYDPEEDKRNDEKDSLTGYYYVTIA